MKEVWFIYGLWWAVNGMKSRNKKFSTNIFYGPQDCFKAIQLFAVGNKIPFLRNSFWPKSFFISNYIFLWSPFFNEIISNKNRFSSKRCKLQPVMITNIKNGLLVTSDCKSYCWKFFQNFFDECQFQSGNCELVMHLSWGDSILYLGEISSWVLILNHDRGSALFFLFWKSLQKY